MICLTQLSDLSERTLDGQEIVFFLFFAIIWKVLEFDLFQGKTMEIVEENALLLLLSRQTDKKFPPNNKTTWGKKKL